MFSLNRAQVIGNLTRDPETRSTSGGQSVTSFAVATNRRWKAADGTTKEDTQFHEVTVWGKLGELAAQMLKKGKRVYVEGRLQTSSWEGSDGAKRSRTEIVAENFIPLTPREDFGDASSTTSRPQADDEPTSKPAAKGRADEAKEEEINLDDIDIPF